MRRAGGCGERGTTHQQFKNESAEYSLVRFEIDSALARANIGVGTKVAVGWKNFRSEKKGLLSR